MRSRLLSLLPYFVRFGRNHRTRLWVFNFGASEIEQNLITLNNRGIMKCANQVSLCFGQAQGLIPKLLPDKNIFRGSTWFAAQPILNSAESLINSPDLLKVDGVSSGVNLYE